MGLEAYPSYAEKNSTYTIQSVSSVLFFIFLFYTGLSFFGLWKLAQYRAEQSTPEAERKYIAANKPPKPVEIKIEGCASGSWNTMKYGHVFVLDTLIQVPCSLSNGKYYLVGREFFFRWQDVISTPTKNEIFFGVVYQGTDRPMDLSEFTKPPPRLTETQGIIEVSLPENSLRAKFAYFNCSPRTCRGWVAVSPNVRTLINVYDERGIDRADLEAIVARVYSGIK